MIEENENDLCGIWIRGATKIFPSFQLIYYGFMNINDADLSIQGDGSSPRPAAQKMEFLKMVV